MIILKFLQSVANCKREAGEYLQVTKFRTWNSDGMKVQGMDVTVRNTEKGIQMLYNVVSF